MRLYMLLCSHKDLFTQISLTSEIARLLDLTMILKPAQLEK